MASADPLSPADELRKHQLLQAEFWQRRHPPKTDPSALPETDPFAPGTLPTRIGRQDPSKAPAPRSEPSHLPDKWHLTRGLDLHPWQQDCIDSWFTGGRRGVIKVVTGAGKTILAIAIAERLQQTVAPGLRVAIVVPTVVLLDQWREELLTRSNLPASAIGIMGGGENATFGAQTRIIICVLNSAAKKLTAMVRAAGVGPSLLLIVDECHRAGAAEMQKVFHTERAAVLGLSATPERDHDPAEDDASEAPLEFSETVLGQELGPVIFELNYADAIRLGVLPPFGIRHYGLSLKPAESVEYERASREIKNLRTELERPGRKGLDLIRWCRSKGAAGNPAAGRLIGLTAERKRILFRMEERGNAVVRILREAFADNPETKAILFHESIDEVMRLFALLRGLGFAIVAEHSDFPDGMRAASLQLFREGTARIIVSARSLIEGFNVPSADLGIIIAATSSVRQRVQTLGRLLRKTKAGDGTEKHATLHVLYATKTVDELIYEKADWERFVGAERNLYFLWPDVENTEPEQAGKAPRVPSPNETEVDEAALRPRETYPGNIDQGLAFTRDSQGTIRTDDGFLIEPNPELTTVLRQSLKTAGRFRVTPARQFVLELEKVEAGWRGVYLGRLTSPVRVVSAATGDVTERDWKPGDIYPLNRAVGKTFSVLQRDPRLIATKLRGEVRFVPPLHAIPDPAKREALQQIQAMLRSAWSKGHKINKVTVTTEGHVVYIWENEARFVGAAPEGPEGFVVE